MPPNADAAAHDERIGDEDGATKEREDVDIHSKQKNSLYTWIDNRVRTKTSVPWGHRPHKVLGLSCLTFAAVAPFLAATGRCALAISWACVAVTSFLSDHVTTGVDSLSHPADRLLAGATLLATQRTVWVDFGRGWFAVTWLSVACYAASLRAIRRGRYDAYVFWHTSWHLVGQASMILCLVSNEPETFRSASTRWSSWWSATTATMNNDDVAVVEL